MAADSKKKYFRIPKGHYGYLKKQKTGLFIKGLLLLAGVITLVLLGIHITGSKRNWMTIFGCLTAIPMALQFTIFFSMIRYKDRPEEEYEGLKQLPACGVFDTGLVVSNRSGKSLEINYACFHEDGIFLFTADEKADIPKSEEYIHSFLRINQCDGHLKLYNNLKQYEKKLRSLTPSDRESAPDKLLQQEGVLRAISM